MTGARQIVAGLESAGVTIAASVPDTWIGQLVEEVRRSSAIRVVDVAREEEAVAVACGANLAGGRGAVLIQNAGLLNSCNGLVTTALQFEIPMLLLVLYAGARGDVAFPALGQFTEPVLSALRIPYYILDDLDRAPELIGGALTQAYNFKKPVAILLDKGVL